MIIGRFNEQEQAVIDGLLSFHPIKRLESVEYETSVELIIDTGADVTLILPDHYRPYLYSDFQDYAERDAGGFGGSFLMRRVPVLKLQVRLEQGGFGSIPLTEVDLAQSHPRYEGFALPSVIGMDVIRQYRLVIDRSRNHVALELPGGSGP